MDLISVIVPVYNVEQYLSICIDSIINQSYRNIEIIIIDDGSTDRCSLICDEYSKVDDRITVIHQKNQGLSAARNSGINIAKGRYIVFVDSDDYIDENAIDIMYTNMISNNADLVICNYRAVYENDEFCYTNDISSNIWTKYDFWGNCYNVELTAFCVVAWNKLYKAEIFKTLRYPVGKCHEDEFVIDKIINNCENICILSKQLYFYRIRKNSITSNEYSIKNLDRAEAYLLRAKSFFENSEIELVQRTLSRSFSCVVFGFKNLDLSIKENKERCNELRRECIKLFLYSLKKNNLSFLFKVKGFVFMLSWRLYWCFLCILNGFTRKE